MTLRIGLTGGVASGKTTVSELFQKLAVPVIDADVISRELLQQATPCYQRVVDFFGSKILLENGDIDRARLRELIFSDRKAKQKLEAIVHPAVREAMLTSADALASPYCILSVPLLIEASMQSLVHRVLVVDVSPQTQLERLMIRDNMTPEQAQRMLDNQCSREQRLACADDIIANEGSEQALWHQVETLHESYLKLAADYR